MEIGASRRVNDDWKNENFGLIEARGGYVRVDRSELQEGPLTVIMLSVTHGPHSVALALSVAEADQLATALRESTGA